VILILGSAAAARAQDYAVGDRVTVDVNMSSDPAYQRWRPGTITEVRMWNGMVSGIFIRTDDGQDIGTNDSHLRPGAPAPATAAAGGAGAPAGSGGSAGPASGAPASTGGGSTRPAAEKGATPTPGVGGGGTVGLSAGGPPGGGAGRDAGTGNCRVGGRVTNRENRSGVVVRADGPSCHVKLDGSGAEEYYLQWMLRPAGQTAEAERGGALETGSYTCWTANGVAGTLRLVIRNGSQYADGDGNSGSYTYDAASGRIQWTSGPWGGFYGTKLGPGKIGISSRPGGFSNTTCDRQ
jgi:hypothetical protein